jgi:hypothetical protein
VVTRRVIVAVSIVVGAAACAPPWATEPSRAEHTRKVEWASFGMDQMDLLRLSDCMFARVYQGVIDWYCHSPLSWTEGYMHDPAWRALNWTTDGCSVIPDKTYAYDFSAPCRQHDFCYRNWPEVLHHWGYRGNEKQSLLAGYKVKCDSQFHNGMYKRCSHSGLLRAYCERIADGAWVAVRTLGTGAMDGRGAA